MDARPRQPRDRVRHRHDAGQAGHAPGGIAAQGAAGNYWNGPYGYGHYLSRFLLPDNGVTNWDGNRLRGNFYAFQVGTVKFISLDADDVIYQDGGSAYLNGTAERRARDHLAGATIPNGTVTYNRFYSGEPEARRGEQLAGARLRRAASPTCRRSGWRRRCRGPPGPRRST